LKIVVTAVRFDFYVSREPSKRPFWKNQTFFFREKAKTRKSKMKIFQKFWELKIKPAYFSCFKETEKSNLLKNKPNFFFFNKTSQIYGARSFSNLPIEIIFFRTILKSLVIHLLISNI